MALRTWGSQGEGGKEQEGGQKQKEKDKKIKKNVEGKREGEGEGEGVGKGREEGEGDLLQLHPSKGLPVLDGGGGGEVESPAGHLGSSWALGSCRLGSSWTLDSCRLGHQSFLSSRSFLDSTRRFLGSRSYLPRSHVFTPLGLSCKCWLYLKYIIFVFSTSFLVDFRHSFCRFVPPIFLNPKATYKCRCLLQLGHQLL